MSASFEGRAEELFLELVELPREEREPTLRARCGDDAGLAERVRELLRCDERVPDGFLEGGALPPTSYLEPGTHFGGFTILRRLGEGGMGTVYVALQSMPKREVALKVIRPGRVSRDSLRRFRHEVEVLGHLHHPGIARIYEAGTASYESAGAVHEQPYFAMELVKGEPILTYVRSNELDARQRLDLVARLCDAVQHAHQRAVLHRDLKPENVLVTLEESTSAGPAARLVGRPVVLDFGIARAIGPQGATVPGETRAGDLVGSLAYMSPEQLAEDGAAVDVRSDVYALGVILYQVLSGKLPHDLEDRSLPEALRVLREEEPAPLESVVPGLKGDVSTIVAKALAKDAERRYPSALELAEDLRRHLGGDPIRARSDSTLYVLRRQLRRHRLALSVAAGVAVLVTVFAVVAALQAGENRRLATRESGARERAATDFRHALDALATLVEVGGERLADVPHAERARHELLLSARDFYEKLRSGREDDPELGETLLRARLTAALIEQYLGNNVACLHGAQTLLAELERAPATPVTAELTARAWTLVGFCHLESGRVPEGEEALLRARASPAAGDDLALRADATNRLAVGYVDTRREREAGELLVPLVAELEAALETGAERELRLPLARNTRLLGALLFETGRIAEAQARYTRAIEILRELVAEEPGRLLYRTELFIVLTNQGLGLWSLGRRDEGLALQREAVELGEGVVRDFPGVPDHRELLVRTYLNLSAAFDQDAAQAEDCLTRARELVDGLLSGDDPLTRYEVLAVAVANNLAGMTLTPQGRHAEAIAELEPALALARSLERELPTDRHLQDLLCLVPISLAHCRSRMGEHAAAMEAFAAVGAIDRADWVAEALVIAERCIAQAIEDPSDDPEGAEAAVDAYAQAAAALLARSLARGVRLAPGFWDAEPFATLRLHPRIAEVVERR